jgi:oxygen-independent coproporphyrinogen-3 oxidase
MTDADLIARYDGRVPRYTSYPTVPHFRPDTGAEIYAQWLAELPVVEPVSLYIHVPFCDRLCLYCGCTTSVVRQERPKRAYAQLLARELELVAGHLGRRAIVTQVHWGGGTPTALPADCLNSLMEHIRALFYVPPGAEIAVEIDPTALTQQSLDALAAMGLTRASLGVQDFDPGVQAAIGRHQSFAETQACAAALRGLGITSLNLDLIYGLPRQTAESVARTARQALALKADRIAVFGYAHVPWMKRHQGLIPEETLPGSVERFAQAQVMRAVLVEGGYTQVGLDHFALPGDAMAVAARERQLQRGFQGYSADATGVLIGVGASAIGTLPQGYMQNEATVPAYASAIGQGRLATARGVALTPDDRLRRETIARVMCDLAADVPAALREDAAKLQEFAADGLVDWDGTRILVTERGRPFLRNIAAVFDAYLRHTCDTPRHAQAV